MTNKSVTNTMFPAHPGWHVAILLDSAPPKLAYEPIIAWDIERIEQDYDRAVKRPMYETRLVHHVEPITSEGNMRHFGNRWGIRRPDGTFEFDCEYFANEGELLQRMAKEEAA